jgi:hypothetical protein
MADIAFILLTLACALALSCAILMPWMNAMLWLSRRR